jgi:hypothetical protein
MPRGRAARRAALIQERPTRQSRTWFPAAMTLLQKDRHRPLATG